MAAQEAICTFREEVYEPNPESQRIYDELYALYCELHDSFGRKGTSFDHYEVMKRLLEISKKTGA